MILEVAILDVCQGQGCSFEKAFQSAQRLIASVVGYKRHELRRCVEKEGRYILLVYWDSVEAHTVGFRGGEVNQQWKELLHHFYDPFPTVEHYELIAPSIAKEQLYL